MKIVEERSSKQQDRYRIIRVNFRPSQRGWLDITVVALAIVVVLLAWLLR
jgi:hypothetical protein